MQVGINNNLVRKKTLFNSVNLIYIAVLLISILAILPLLSIIINSLHYNLNLSSFIFNDILRYIINSLNILFYVIFFTSVFGVVSAYLVSFFDFLSLQPFLALVIVMRLLLEIQVHSHLKSVQVFSS